MENGEGGEGGGGTWERTVSDDHYQDVQDEIFDFLADVGFTAKNPAAPPTGEAVSEEARARGLTELTRDMRDFDWTNEAACDVAFHESPQRQPTPHKVRKVLPEERKVPFWFPPAKQRLA